VGDRGPTGVFGIAKPFSIPGRPTEATFVAVVFSTAPFRFRAGCAFLAALPAGAWAVTFRDASVGFRSPGEEVRREATIAGVVTTALDAGE